MHIYELFPLTFFFLTLGKSLIVGKSVKWLFGSKFQWYMYVTKLEIILNCIYIVNRIPDLKKYQFFFFSNLTNCSSRGGFSIWLRKKMKNFSNMTKVLLDWYKVNVLVQLKRLKLLHFVIYKSSELRDEESGKRIVLYSNTHVYIVTHLSIDQAYCCLTSYLLRFV